MDNATLVQTVIGMISAGIMFYIKWSVGVINKHTEQKLDDLNSKIEELGKTVHDIDTKLVEKVHENEMSVASLITKVDTNHADHEARIKSLEKIIDRRGGK